MAIGSNLAYSLLRGFAKKPGYPAPFSPEEEAMVEALMEHAEDDQHAQKINKRLMTGFRDPALDPSERARQARFAPGVVDIIAAAIEPDPQTLQPDEFKQSRVNPVDQLIGSGWFYEIMPDRLIATTEEWCQSPNKSLQVLGKQIMLGIEARRNNMTPTAWREERERANRQSERVRVWPAL